MENLHENKKFNEIADIHLHPTLHAFSYHYAKPGSKRAQLRNNPRLDAVPADTILRLAGYIQSNLYFLKRGKVRIAFISLYPFEQGWFDDESTTDLLISLILNLAPEYVRKIKSRDFDYFEYFKKEHEYLIEQVNLPKKPFAEVPTDNSFLNNIKNDDKIYLIVTLEGGHTFINGNSSDVDNINVDSIIENIKWTKQNTNLFFVTLAHHYYNGFIGHARSIYFHGPIEYQFLKNRYERQKKGMGGGISADGKRIINYLLSLSPEAQETPRVLIDVKHMSVAARKEFYKMLDGKNIPIIASHAAYAGVETLDMLKEKSEDYGYKIDKHIDDYDKMLDFVENFHKSNRFLPFEINLTDEDVVNICKSKGLIGVMLDEKKLGIKKSYTAEKSAEIFADNWLTMVKVAIKAGISPEIVWKVFTIGSDFDGFINPFDQFRSEAQMPKFARTLVKVLSKNSLFASLASSLPGSSLIKKAEKAVSLLVWENVVDFLKKHYPSVSKFIS